MHRAPVVAVSSRVLVAIPSLLPPPRPDPFSRPSAPSPLSSPLLSATVNNVAKHRRASLNPSHSFSLLDSFLFCLVYLLRNTIASNGRPCLITVEDALPLGQSFNTHRLSDNAPSFSPHPPSPFSRRRARPLQCARPHSTTAGGAFAPRKIVRKWKFAPSSKFEERMQPIDFSPGTGSMEEVEEKAHRRGYAQEGYEQPYAGYDNNGGYPAPAHPQQQFHGGY
ncbi:hypothetical protein CALVIDRAFT_34779 [Calocera viscosa TUFC12733]|uniref:Uncharacterized protein n=1 Tax=Calocera viscosa (strain TUFC12733) TaxID=1330018 RepID=A0A167FNV5_CALVF|nr:hypothetical protein CALVIDRAFT_34779 [Calocera viscosa TUFC12733]